MHSRTYPEESFKSFVYSLAYSPVEHEHAAGARDGDGDVSPDQLSEVLLLQCGGLRGGVDPGVGDSSYGRAATAATERTDQ